MKKCLFSLFVFLFMCTNVYADELSELKEMFRKSQTQMTNIQVQMNEMAERIAQLEKEKQNQSDQDNQEIKQLQARIDELEQSGNESPKSLVSTLNPQVSVLGDMIYKSTDEDGAEGGNNFNLREVELAFSANVDTYARGDIIIAIENEDGNTEVAVEEGYLTLLETPIENLQGKFGKFRPYFGKTNKMHLHQLPWVDYPLVVKNFFGEEGFSEAGVSLNYLIPNPADIYSELTIEAVNNGETVFGDGENGGLIYLAHLKNFFEITDDTSLEVGVSFALGENENENSSKSSLTGFDLTLNTCFLDNRRTTSHTEALFNKREQDSQDDIDSWGLFTSLEQQLTDRWWTFGRYDFSQTPKSSGVDTHAYSVGLTYAQSEYVFWRAMFTHTDNQISEDVNTVWLQLDFAMGPHKPHTYR